MPPSEPKKPRKPYPKTLTLKQEKFVQEYLKCGNASEAFRIVYPHSREWQDTSVWETASRLLAINKVRSRVELLKERMVQKALVTPQMIRNELAKMAFSNISNVIRIKKNDRGEMVLDFTPTDELDEKTISAISEINPTPTGIKIKLHDKKAALELLGRDLGMFKETIEISDSKIPEFIDPDPDV